MQILKSTKGFVLVWSAVFMLTALSFIALAIDVSYGYVISTELKATADSGALTAASSFVAQLKAAEEDGELTADDLQAIHDTVVQTATAMVNRSSVLGHLGDISINVEFGEYDLESTNTYDERTGVPYTDHTDALTSGGFAASEIMAFRVTAHRSRADNNLKLFFADLLGWEFLRADRNSVSILAPRNFILVIDTSGSMDDLSYIRTTTQNPDGSIQPALPNWPPDESYFIRYPERIGTPDGDILMAGRISPHSPTMGVERYVGFDPIEPEPLQTVFDSSLAFLRELDEISAVGDSAGVFYFSSGAISKMPEDHTLVRISNETIENQFVPGGGSESFSSLFSNATLYSNLIRPELEVDEDEHFLIAPGFNAFDHSLGQYTGFFGAPVGFTNIGGAINQAIAGIQEAQTLVSSISIIVLFTDGQPTCGPWPGETDEVDCWQTPSDAQTRRAVEYAYASAKTAIEAGILIYPISYGDLSGSVPGANTEVLLDQIALMSGLESHFRIGSSTDPVEVEAKLQEIYNEISLLIPFALVG